MMEVTLKIKGMHIHNGAEEEQLELVTEGKLYQRGNTIYLLYEESEVSGMEGFKTRLSIKDDVVCMSRKSPDARFNTEMCFEKGTRHSGLYNTEYGPVEIEILTNSLQNLLDEDGVGDIDIDYSISLKGITEGRSRLNIEVNRRVQ